MRILVTGGPVHAKLDAVKFVTNRFKGGLMAKLAVELADAGHSVTFLVSNHVAKEVSILDKSNILCAVIHDGFHDYRKKVMEMAPDFDAVVLGAAVANLIPVCYHPSPLPWSMSVPKDYNSHIEMPLEGKFPSHDYKPGDRIYMEWQIAPRIVDEAKSHMKPGAHLFAFKLLKGVPHEELISAAYEIVLESKATCVFANDADDLGQVYAVMKDRSVHPMKREEMTGFILELMQDKYYRTVTGVQLAPTLPVLQKSDALVEKYRSRFTTVEGGYIFGIVAVRAGSSPAFVTTKRGKNELDGRVFVTSVNHKLHVVITSGGKATLNAPLLHRIFEQNIDVAEIVHLHEEEAELPVYDYAPPGTVRDSERPTHTSFNIRGHGCFLLLDKEGKQL